MSSCQHHDNAVRATRPGVRTLLLAALLAIGPATAARAQSAESGFPARAVRIIVPHTPGGLVDTFVRYVAEDLSVKWKQPVVVDNKPGANQIIGAEAAANSPPDGYTLFVGTQTGLVFNAVLKKSLRFDPVKDFAPITGLFNTPFYMVVNSQVKASSVADVVRLAKAAPGKMTYASIGEGSSQHLAAEMFKSMAGVDILHVPYKGSGPALADLLGGQVDLMFEGGTSSLPSVQSGKLKAMASSGAHRSIAMPSLPTISETIPGYTLSVWMGLVAPAGTPPSIVDQLNRDVTATLRKPETQKKFASVDIEVMPTSPQELSSLIAGEIPRWRKIMKDAGMQPE